jgi:hypothetical protein
MDPEVTTQEDAQAIWDEEAAKLDAGDEPAVEVKADAPADDQQVEQPPQDPQPEQAAAAAQEEQQADPFAGLPEAVKAKLAELDSIKESQAQLLHHVKTAEGRVAAMQRELQQARQAQQSVAATDAPTQSEMNAAAKNPEKWEQLKQDFPEWAGAMEEYVAAKLQGTKQASGLQPSQVEAYVREQVSAVEQRAERLIQEAQIEGAHEGWKQKVNSPEFVAWFQLQAPDVRALADSPRAGDAIKMLNQFEASRSKSATEIKQEREARLAAAATVRPGVTKPAKTLDDMSPEELWNYEAKQREKTRAERGF